jgi:hypothetical protein
VFSCLFPIKELFEAAKGILRKPGPEMECRFGFGVNEVLLWMWAALHSAAASKTTLAMGNIFKFDLAEIRKKFQFYSESKRSATFILSLLDLRLFHEWAILESASPYMPRLSSFSSRCGSLGCQYFTPSRSKPVKRAEYSAVNMKKI